MSVSPIWKPRMQPTYPGKAGASGDTFNSVKGSYPPRFNWKYSVGGAGGRCGAKTSRGIKISKGMQSNCLD